MSFEIGQFAVCPGHGVGQICNVEEKTIGDQVKSFFIVKILQNGMTIMVPTDSETGIRKLMEHSELTSIFHVLNDHEIEIDKSTWNRRYRDYMTKIKTGSLIEIAEVLRALFLLKGVKSLSFGEKKMLEQCRDLISSEISIATGNEQNSINNDIESCFPQ